MSAKRFAVLEGENVINVIVADSDFIAQHYPAAIECADEVSVGWCYDGKDFYIRVYEVEEEVTP
jgi:hypothetical protein